MQQEQSSPPSEMVKSENSKPFSPSIVKLAQTYELGQPQQEYLASFPLDPNGRAISFTIAIWLLALLIILLIIFLRVFYPQIGIALILLLTLLVAAPLLTLLIWAFAFSLQRRRKNIHYQRIYVCTSGLLCQKLNTIEAIHWHHIDAVNYDAVGNCQVHRNDGAVFSFSPPLQQLGDLSSHIEQAVIPHHLPQLLKSYHNGLPIVFGPLRINQQGIGLTQKNVILFAWDKIQGIERRFDSLILQLYNDRTLGLPLTAHEIPSVSLAQAVIRAILEQFKEITDKLPDSRKPGVKKGQRGQLGQKSQEARSEVNPEPTIDGTLTNIMGDPIGSATSNRLSVVVYEQGFLYLNKAEEKLDIVRWDQIVHVIRRTHKNSGHIEYSIEVTSNDETTFVFPHTQPLIAGIGLYVEQKVAEWVLSDLIQQYDNNETISFGKLSINHTGITYNNRSLPWSEVYQAYILQPNSAYIGIKQRGYNREWQLIGINNVPDVYLLKLLIDHILSTHPAVQR